MKMCYAIQQEGDIMQDNEEKTNRYDIILGKAAAKRTVYVSAYWSYVFACMVGKII